MSESDPRLAASLRAPSWAADPYPLAALLERHWEPVYDFAVLCAPATGRPAAALAAAAVHQVLRTLERARPVAALRPQLLSAVRDVAAAWATSPQPPAGAPGGPARSASTAAGPTAGVAGAAGATGATGGSRTASAGFAGARSNPTGGPADPGDPRLALHSFESLAPVAQCLLWHTAVDAEPVCVPAALSALDIGTALTELEAARGQFRTGLLHWHADLADHAACRFYNRFLDVRPRGPAVQPDVRHHLLTCTHCAGAVAQLDLCRRQPGLLLARALLGPPGVEYLATRPGRRPPSTDGPGTPDEPAGAPHRAPRAGRGARAGRHRLMPDGSAPRPLPPTRYRKAVRAGAGLASACALGAVLTAALWPSDGDGAAVPPGVARTESAVPDAEAPPADGTPLPTPAAYDSASWPLTGARSPEGAARPLPEEGDGAAVQSGGS